MKGVAMFTRLGRCKTLAAQAVVYLQAVFLSINLLTVSMASGNDAMVDNHIGSAGDSRKPTHEEKLLPYHSLHDSLRNRMEEERRNPRSRDEYLRYNTQRKDKKAGLENPRYPTSEEEVIGNGVDGAHTATGTWAIEAVDAPKLFPYNTSRIIAVDAGNHPHFVYGGNHMNYAYHDGSSWHYETADASFDVGANASLALDALGHAHISYQDNYNRDLKYATNVSGSWVTTTVDSYGWVGFTSSIAIDASGHVHISYCDESEFNTKDNLKYATNVSGSWETFTVDSVYAFFESSIAVDSSGHAHISYSDGNLGLRYATNVSGSWLTTAVDKSRGAGGHTSLALDASGYTHISYQRSSYTNNNDLMYITNVSGPWVATTVDSSVLVGNRCSIALDKTNNAHISYLDYTNFDLKYATNASGAWVTTTVDSNGDVGFSNSIAIDSSGYAHISYRDYSNATLKYATNASGAW